MKNLLNLTSYPSIGPLTDGGISEEYAKRYGTQWLERGCCNLTLCGFDDQTGPDGVYPKLLYGGIP